MIFFIYLQLELLQKINKIVSFINCINPLLYTPIETDRNIIFETLKLVSKMNIKNLL